MPEISELIAQFVDKELSKERLYTVIGTATNVNETDRKCNFTPVGDEGGQFDVRLQSAFTGILGVVLIPKENSIIGVSFLNRTAGFVSLTSELEKVLIDTSLTEFNGGDNGGLINVSDLVTKLNNLESDMNLLKAAFTAWVVVATDGGAALKATTAAWAAQILTTTVATELEDGKVKH